MKAQKNVYITTLFKKVLIVLLVLIICKRNNNNKEITVKVEKRWNKVRN
nr:hypothetical protein [Mycoplasmopsis bovis]